jgi:hypothetical protein
MPYLIDGHNLIPKLGIPLSAEDDETKLVAYGWQATVGGWYWAVDGWWWSATSSQSRVIGSR